MLMRHLGLALTLALAWAPAVFAADRYAAPTGTGTTCSNASPCSVATMWSQLAPGDTGWLQDGIYTGASAMLQISSLHGTQAAPITIKAVNDGAVLLDGQHARTPFSASGSSWLIFEGFNAARGISTTVFWTNVTNSIMRRVVAWDGSLTENADVMTLTSSGSTDNLWEDVAGFGTGKNVLAWTRVGSGNVCRRCFADWQGSTNYNFKRVINVLYAPPFLGLKRCENCIALWSAFSMPATYTLTDADGNPDPSNQTFTNHAVQLPGALYWSYGGEHRTADISILGSLGIVPASVPGDTGPTLYALLANEKGNVRVRHSMMFAHPSHPRFSLLRGFRFDGADNTGNVADHVTSVRGLADTSQSVSYTNSTLGSTLTINPWTNTGAGVNLCKRWTDGAVTNEPLWPWPMNERIKAAYAASGRYTGPCVNCTWPGGQPPLRTAFDLTAYLEDLVGSIPAECRSDLVTPPPTVSAPTVQYTIDEASSGTCSSLVDSGAGTALNLTCSSVTP